MAASERSSKTMRRTVRAVSAKESVHADHASQEAARALIQPTPRPCVLAPLVTTPFYSTVVSQTLRGPLSEPERAEPPKRIKAIYACIDDTWCGFFEEGAQPAMQPLISTTHPLLQAAIYDRLDLVSQRSKHRRYQ